MSGQGKALRAHQHKIVSQTRKADDRLKKIRERKERIKDNAVFNDYVSDTIKRWLTEADQPQAHTRAR